MSTFSISRGFFEKTLGGLMLATIFHASAFAQTAPPLRMGNTSIDVAMPGNPSRKVIRDQTAQSLLAQGQAGALQKAGQRYESLGLYPEAADAFARAESKFDNAGLIQQGLIAGASKNRNTTVIRLFEVRPLGEAERAVQQSSARLEPQIGCYIGSFIDQDTQLDDAFFAENRRHVDPGQFDKVMKRRHGSIFTYIGYKRALVNGDWIDSAFPLTWMNRCKAEGKIPQIALEPHNLDEVQDDEFLLDFARRLRAFDWPVFVRYGSEMNGNWTNWGAGHVSAETYKQKFRTVYTRIHSIAPKAAMIWCPNAIPANLIPTYYPGDAYCDWVGVNFYSVPYLNNDLERPASKDSPLPYLDTVYQMYAARKPIAICEWGASRETKIAGSNRDCSDFSRRQMALLYDALPRLYPRVKLVNWFDMNALLSASHGRKLNNYNLTADSNFRNYYRDVVSDDYFLDRYGQKIAASEGIPVALRPGTPWSGQQLEVYVKSPELSPRVYVSLNGTTLYAARGNRAHTLVLPYNKLHEGNNALRVAVFDKKGDYLDGVSTFISRGETPTTRIASAPPINTNNGGAPPRVKPPAVTPSVEPPAVILPGPASPKPTPKPQTAPVPPQSPPIFFPKTPPIPDPASPSSIADDVLKGIGDVFGQVLSTPKPTQPKGQVIQAAWDTSNANEVTVTIQQYLANEFGLVCAARVQTAGTPEVVFFPPILGKAIVTAFPPGTKANVSIHPRLIEGGTSSTRVWDLEGVVKDVVSGNNRISALTVPNQETALDLNQLWDNFAALQLRPQQIVTGDVITASRLDVNQIGLLAPTPSLSAVSLFLNGRTLVYLPPDLRVPVEQSIYSGPLGNVPPVSLRVTGTTLTLPAGALGIFDRAMVATRIEVLVGGKSFDWTADEARPYREYVAKRDGRMPSILNASLNTPDLNTAGLSVYSGSSSDLLRSGISGKLTQNDIKNLPLSPAPTADELAMRGEYPW